MRAQGIITHLGLSVTHLGLSVVGIRPGRPVSGPVVSLVAELGVISVTSI
jgi:hypothetical protein